MRTDIVFRKMLPGEEASVLELVRAAFAEFVLPDVTKEGAEEFFRAARQMIYDRPANHFILVAESEGSVSGMIDVRDNSHICLFFVRKADQRKGVGRRLLVRATEACIEGNAAVPEIEVNSSLFAVSIYKKFGFRETKREQFVNGIRFVPMAKDLR